MSKHDSLIMKYKDSAEVVSLSIGSLNFFKAIITGFNSGDDQVVIESRDELYPSLKFACHKANVMFLVKA